jgi:hypothetical protein
VDVPLSTPGIKEFSALTANSVKLAAASNATFCQLCRKAALIVVRELADVKGIRRI